MIEFVLIVNLQAKAKAETPIKVDGSRDLGYSGTMKTITYKDKKLKLPYDLTEGESTADMVTRINPLSGQSIELPRFAAIVYDTVMDLNLKAERKDKATKQQPGFSEHQDDWQKVRNGINFFRQYFAKEYMVLLD